MPLRDTSALVEWELRDKPTEARWLIVRDWIAGLDDAPWQYPSIPLPELGGQPEYEIRTAVVPESGGVEVFYRQEYVTGAVDLIWVRNAGG